MIIITILIIIMAIAIPNINLQLSPIVLTRITAIAFLYAGVISFNTLYIQSIGSGIGIYSGLFSITLISQVFETFIYLTASLILVAWPILTTNKSNNNTYSYSDPLKGSEGREYSLIVLFSTLGASLLVSSGDLISMYLSIELQSFGVYILATIYRESDLATSAGLKYFLLGALSSCFILLGSGLVYSYTGLTNLESIYTLIPLLENNNLIQGFSLGIILIIIGFLFKIAAAPLHNWAPDVYDNSPTIVTIWLTIMPKISILIFLLELQSQIGIIESQFSFILNPEILNEIKSLPVNLINENNIFVLKNLLLLSSLLSLIIGTVVGLAQTRIKRLLSYSTISHVGFILLALAINSEQSIDSLLFYIIQYTITNLNTFLVLIAFAYLLHKSIVINSNNNKDNNNNLKFKFNDIIFISQLKGQFFSNPLLSLALTISLFSMAGIPPLIGFFSKQFVLFSAVQSGYYFMAILAILVSVISASYYLKVIRILHEEITDLNSSININNNISNSDSNNNNINSNIIENKDNNTDKNNISPQRGKVELINNQALKGEEENYLLSNYHSFLISSLTLSILLFVLNPSIILNSTKLLSLSLFNS